MKKFLFAILMILGISFASQAQQIYISTSPILYGITKVWVEVDNYWFETFLYEDYCRYCGHYYQCEHRYGKRHLLYEIPRGAYVGTVVYLHQPHHRPSYYRTHYDYRPHHYEWYHPEYVHSRPYHQPAPKHYKPAPKPAPQHQGSHNVAPHHNYENSSSYHRPNSSSRSTVSTRSSAPAKTTTRPQSSGTTTKSYSQPQRSSSSSSVRSSVPSGTRSASTRR